MIGPPCHCPQTGSADPRTVTTYDLGVNVLEMPLDYHPMCNGVFAQVHSLHMCALSTVLEGYARFAALIPL